MPDTPHEREFHHVWSELVKRGLAAPGELDAALVEQIRRELAGAGEAMPDPTYAKQLREDLMNQSLSTSTIRLSSVSAAHPERNGYAAAPSGRSSEPVRSPSWLRGGIAQIAAAALLLVTLGFGYLALKPGSGEPEGSNSFPAMIAPGTPVAEASPTTVYISTRGHQIVGVWEVDVDDTCPGCNLTTAVFDEDGTFVWAGDGDLVGIGTWRPTGDRTVEVAFAHQQLDSEKVDDVFDAAIPPHQTEWNSSGDVLYWNASLTMDETGKTIVSIGEIQAYDGAGNLVWNPEMTMYWTRMINDPEAVFAIPAP